MEKRTKNIWKRAKNIVYSVPIALMTFLPSCEPENDPPEPPVVPPKKSVEQYVSLKNDVEIAYSATLSNVAKAQLNVSRDGTQVSTKEINDLNNTGADYQTTFTYSSDGFTKGNYEFVTKGDNIEKKSTVEIPNYKPTGNFTNLNINMEQGGNTSVTLPELFDKNPEDKDKLGYLSAKSLDGKTSTTLTGDELGINALPNQTGDYRVEIEFGSTAGGLEKSVISGNINPRSWKFYVNPFVQPNDTTKPIIWNNLSLSQRVAHFNDRLYNYDKTDEIEDPDWVCSDYVTAWKIAFNGYPMEGLKNNNWHNIPAYDVTIRIYNKPTHAAGGVNLGNSVANINDWRFIETQNDSTYTPAKLKEFGAYEIEINYTRVMEDETQGKILDNLPILKFVLNNKGEWVDSGYRHPDINLVETR